jgi:hypothetical protein
MTRRRPVASPSFAWLSFCVLLTTSTVILGFVTPGFAQQRIIELQVHADARARVGTQQRWMEMLSTVGADRVVLKTGFVAEPEIEETKLSATALVTISGSISGEKLFLPGGSFSIRDKAGIRELIQRIRDDGARVALAEKKAFGLTSDQLVELHQLMRKPLNFNTQSMSAAEFVQDISKLIGREFALDATARTALAGSATVAEELSGVSSGTALAVVLRPFGLVWQPRRLQGKPLELMIVDSGNSSENWPIGWPIENPPVQVEPRLFERLQLEIRGYPLSDALNAIEKRSGVPFFYDQNSLARAGVELAETKVTLVQDKASFMVAIDKLLRQSKPKLIDELRVDENGKAFLWITTR